MKPLISRLLAVLSVSFLVIACTSQPAIYPASGATTIAAGIVEQTVALYSLNAASPRCTGIWVAPRRILTAGHCVSEDVLDPLFYTVPGEYVGVLKSPKFLHSLALLKQDIKHDLALYETGVFDTPQHAIATLATASPVVGSVLHFMGHTRAMAWSYKSGWVSFYREKDFASDIGFVGPWMQASAPISNGDSGGGAFNDQGELVGVCSFLIRGVPDNSQYSVVATIRGFLQS